MKKKYKHSKLKIHKIIYETQVEGCGNRTAIFLQGCLKHCKGCNSPQTWDINGGKTYEVEELIETIPVTKIEGITISGGEPLLQAEALVKFCRDMKECGMGIILFTGYTYEYICKVNNADWNNLLEYVDLLIDGEYQEDNPTLRAYIGSNNQQYHFLTDRYTPKDLITPNKLEIRIENGSITVNGMGNNKKIRKLLNGV